MWMTSKHGCTTDLECGHRNLVRWAMSWWTNQRDSNLDLEIANSPGLCTSTKEAMFTEVDRSRTDCDQGFPDSNSTRGKNLCFPSEFVSICLATFAGFVCSCTVKLRIYPLSPFVQSPPPLEMVTVFTPNRDRTSSPLPRSIVHSMESSVHQWLAIWSWLCDQPTEFDPVSV